MSKELERVAFLAQRFAGTGIGDDCAVLEGGLVWTVDAQVEGTHFRLDWLDWEDVGWRSFVAAASDLGAMGALPIAALSALVLADGVDDRAFDALTRGQAAAAAIVGAPIVGGNMARGSETSVTTTLLGRTNQPILRSGARKGDGVYLAGPVGRAAAGLEMLRRGIGTESSRGGIDTESVRVCIAAWRRPEVLRRTASSATAMIDISDGLAHDLMQIARASNVSVTLDEASLVDPVLEDAARMLGTSAIDLALFGGEDYALVATGDALPGFERIGSIEAGPSAVKLGARVLDARGFDHFSEAKR